VRAANGDQSRCIVSSTYSHVLFLNPRLVEFSDTARLTWSETPSGEMSSDLHAYVYGRFGVAGEDADDLLRNLHNHRMIFVPDSKTPTGRRYIPMSD
jgi:hypothetical protein